MLYTVLYASKVTNQLYKLPSLEVAPTTCYLFTVFDHDLLFSRSCLCLASCPAENVSSCEFSLFSDFELWPVFFIYYYLLLCTKLVVDSVEMNQRAKYLGRRSFRSKVIVQTDTHVRPRALPGPQTSTNWSVVISPVCSKIIRCSAMVWAL